MKKLTDERRKAIIEIWDIKPDTRFHTLRVKATQSGAKMMLILIRNGVACDATLMAAHVLGTRLNHDNTVTIRGHGLSHGLELADRVCTALLGTFKQDVNHYAI